MIRSMTAFARVSENTREGSWVVEIRSLNNRYLDLSIRLPGILTAYETQVRDLIQSELKRGKISLNISREAEEETGQKVVLNEPLLHFYINSLKKVQKKYRLAGGITLGDFLKVPGVFTVQPTTQDPKKLWNCTKRLLKKALKQMIESKEEEGKKLSSDIQNRLDSIGKAVHRIEKSAQGRAEQTFKKLKERIHALVGEHSQDDERLYRELAFLTERSDITEETVRMKSHFDLFRSRLKGESEVGRELDFFCQEINREVNTMGSKSQFFEISTEVVFIKGELEKIREQVQNIE